LGIGGDIWKAKDGEYDWDSCFVSPRLAKSHRGGASGRRGGRRRGGASRSGRRRATAGGEGYLAGGEKGWLESGERGAGGGRRARCRWSVEDGARPEDGGRSSGRRPAPAAKLAHTGVRWVRIVHRSRTVRRSAGQAGHGEKIGILAEVGFVGLPSNLWTSLDCRYEPSR